MNDDSLTNANNRGPYSYSVGTGAIIFSQDGDSILLIEEHKAPGHWGIVGGKLEKMPSASNVQKEIMEETGYAVRLDGVIGIYQRYDSEPQTISFIYRATAVGQRSDPDASEVIRVRWFNVDEIPWDRLRFGDNRVMIQDAIANPSMPISIIRSLPG